MICMVDEKIILEKWAQRFESYRTYHDSKFLKTTTRIASADLWKMLPYEFSLLFPERPLRIYDS